MRNALALRDALRDALASGCACSTCAEAEAMILESSTAHDVLRGVARRIEKHLGPFTGAPFMVETGSGRLRCVFCGEETKHEGDCPALMLRYLDAATPESETP